MNDMDDRLARALPRWWEHAGVKRYGWLTWYVQSPRFWRWGVHTEIFICQSFNLGLSVYRDEEAEMVVNIGLAIIDIRMRRVPFITKRRARELQEEFARRHGEQLADEAESFLREHS